MLGGPAELVGHDVRVLLPRGFGPFSIEGVRGTPTERNPPPPPEHEEGPGSRTPQRYGKAPLPNEGGSVGDKPSIALLRGSGDERAEETGGRENPERSSIFRAVSIRDFRAGTTPRKVFRPVLYGVGLGGRRDQFTTSPLQPTTFPPASRTRSPGDATSLRWGTALRTSADTTNMVPSVASGRPTTSP